MYFLLKEYVVGAAVLLTVASLGVRQVLTFWEEFEEASTRKLWCICTNSKLWDQTGLHYWFASQFRLETAPAKTYYRSHSTTNLPPRNAMFMCNTRSSCFLFAVYGLSLVFRKLMLFVLLVLKSRLPAKMYVIAFLCLLCRGYLTTYWYRYFFVAFSAAQTYPWQS